MCAMEIQVEAPVGQVIGYVKQQSVVATFSSAHGGHTLLKVKRSPSQTKFVGGLNLLHEADDDAVIRLESTATAVLGK